MENTVSQTPLRLIVYACPTGPLAAQLDSYFTHAKAQFGHNTAHDYMPHITLTGFFPETPAAIPHYAKWLAEAYIAVQAQRPHPPVCIEGWHLTAEFHGLVISAPWLKELIQHFMAIAQSPTRPEPIRPKDWLHLSLAYNFAAHEDAPLRKLAQALVDPHAPAAWELRLYSQTQATSSQADTPQADIWSCHTAWPL
ncbi:MAG: hypothetical protein WDZ49_03580 [Litorilinea sp.]